MSMEIIGISRTEKGDKITTTLYVKSPFEEYYMDADSGRSCEGEKTETIYVGSYDCSALEVSQEIEVYYGKGHISACRHDSRHIRIMRKISSIGVPSHMETSKL